jgi:hypothetical protein
MHNKLPYLLDRRRSEHGAAVWGRIDAALTTIKPFAILSRLAVVHISPASGCTHAQSQTTITNHKSATSNVFHMGFYAQQRGLVMVLDMRCSWGYLLVNSAKIAGSLRYPARTQQYIENAILKYALFTSPPSPIPTPRALQVAMCITPVTCAHLAR